MILSSHITVSASWKVSTEFVWVRYLQSSYIFTILSQSVPSWLLVVSVEFVFLTKHVFCAFRRRVSFLSFYFSERRTSLQIFPPNSHQTNQIQHQSQLRLSKPRFPRKASYVFFSLARSDLFLHCYWPLNQCDFGFMTLNWKRSIFSFCLFFFYH